MPLVGSTEKQVIGLWQRLKMWGGYPTAGGYFDQDEELMEFIETVELTHQEFERKKLEEKEREMMRNAR